jgi:hypothetical protein
VNKQRSEKYRSFLFDENPPSFAKKRAFFTESLDFYQFTILYFIPMLLISYNVYNDETPPEFDTFEKQAMNSSRKEKLIHG